MTKEMKPRIGLALTAAVVMGAATAVPASAVAGGAQKGWLSEYEYRNEKVAQTPMSQKADIVDTAVSDGSFNTLVTAVKAAGLVEVLKGEGPFTVFAPTDEAFAKLPAGTIEALLADKEKLTSVLTYHVVPGYLEAVDVLGMQRIKTVQGSELTIGRAGDGAMVDAATIIKTDIVTRNGVIHVIDSVVIPSES